MCYPHVISESLLCRWTCHCQVAFNKPECMLADDPQDWGKAGGKSRRCLSDIYRVSTEPTVTSFSSFAFNSLITLREEMES